MRRVLQVVLLVLMVGLRATPVSAQSPNNGGLLVVVIDQSGAVVPGARVVVTNTATGLMRETTSGDDGTVVLSALPLDGSYRVAVAKPGFTADDVTGLALRASESATVRITLVASGGASEVVVYGTEQGVRANAQVGRRVDQALLEATPILGRKITTVPLLNSAFRQGKGTGDLFVNATFFITGGGSRRTTTYMLDGANNDEGWGRQMMVATVPMGAVKEMDALTSALSAEYGWTAGPALNIVTRSGSNDRHGEALVMARPGAWQTRTLPTTGFCPPSVPSCVTPSTLRAINPADVPDALMQYSAAAGGPLVRDRTFYFVAGDVTRQDRTTQLSPSLPAFVLIDGRLDYVGRYRQTLANGRVDHQLSSAQSLMFRANLDRFYDTNPNDAVAGTNAPTVARKYSRASMTGQLNHTYVLGTRWLNEWRGSYSHGDPVTRWEAQTRSTTFTRVGAVPFTIGESRQSDIYSRQAQAQDTVTWSAGRHTLRVGVSAAQHESGGTGSEPGLATLGTVTFLSTGTAPFDQLTLADVQTYSQPVSYGVTSYALRQWLLVGFAQDTVRVSDSVTLDLGLRYDRQTLTDATANLAPRLGISWHPSGDARTVLRAGYGRYYTQIRANRIGAALIGGLDGITSYSATPGQTGFPACLTAACLPVALDPRTLPVSQRPPRNVTLRPGPRDAVARQFAQFGLNVTPLADRYPVALVNPRSQVATLGAEREVASGLFVSGDYVYQHWDRLDRTVDVNAPSAFDRTAPGQVRTVTAADATRPLTPASGGVRQVNVLMNLGVSDYHALQTLLSYKGSTRLTGSLSYTLAKATNTTEPDGNGIGPNQAILTRLGEEERGPSVVDQRHRAVLALTYAPSTHVAVGSVTQLASARPFNATTGLDNNGDGVNDDRPVIDGRVVGKSAFRGTATQDVSAFIEGRVRVGRQTLQVRLEGFNLLNHVNILGRAQTVYGDGVAPAPTFGQLVAVGTATSAIPALPTIDPSRMYQLQVRWRF